MTRATSIAESWQQYVDTLPITTPEPEVVRLRRAYYMAALDVAALQDRGVTREAIRSEALGFGRTVGRPIERAA